MFIAAIKLRLSEPDHYRAFKIPGGLFGMLFVAGIGMIGVCTTLAVSFIPPDGIDVGSFARYEATLILGLMLMCLPPFLSSWLRPKAPDLEPVV
jgi:hypothetical protein